MTNDPFDIPGLPNQMHGAPGYASGGQPTEAQLAAAARNGLQQIINLRSASEDTGFDEAGAAARLGLRYAVLGIAGPQDLTIENVRRFDALLAQSQGVPTLVHCGSGNRVGAMIALRAGWLQGAPTSEALATGRCWGLTKLEPVVSQLLTEKA